MGGKKGKMWNIIDHTWNLHYKLTLVLFSPTSRRVVTKLMGKCASRVGRH